MGKRKECRVALPKVTDRMETGLQIVILPLLQRGNPVRQPAGCWLDNEAG
jgi:hypothetical protein